MNIQEMIVAVEHKLPIIIAILNNEFLGMVRQWQEFFFEKRYSHTSLKFSPNFKKLAEAYGAVGITIDKKEDVEKAIKEALSIKDRPIVLDFHVAKEENVYPMVPSGKSVKDTILRELA
jgi:acetolactate synthase-1/2/3 large subunit